MSEDNESKTLQVVDGFLRANLLGALGDDEQRYEHLYLTVNDLTKELSADTSELIAFSRVAFQPEPSPHEPVLDEVYNRLKAHWKLIDNVYTQERPLVLLRAVMLEVVRHLCIANAEHASVVYHSNVSAQPHYRHRPEEALIITNLLTEAGGLADAFAIELFLRHSEEDNAAPSVNITVPKSVAVDTSQLQDGLLAAVGPHDENSEPPKATPANPNFPNSGPPWSYAYPKIAASAISKTIEASVRTGLSALAKATSEAVVTSLGTFAENHSQMARSSPRSLDVLWWQQTLFSPTMRRSYRDVEPVVAAVCMAHDLLDMHVVPSPESVVYILGEAVRDAVADHDPKRRSLKTLTKWLEALATSGDKHWLGHLIDQAIPLPSRSASLVEVVRTTLNGHEPPRETLGALFEAEVTPRQLAMWLFRDLLSERLVAAS